VPKQCRNTFFISDKKFVVEKYKITRMRARNARKKQIKQFLNKKTTEQGQEKNNYKHLDNFVLVVYPLFKGDDKNDKKCNN
jgi:hypothetical protein